MIRWSLALLLLAGCSAAPAPSTTTVPTTTEALTPEEGYLDYLQEQGMQVSTSEDRKGVINEGLVACDGLRRGLSADEVSASLVGPTDTGNAAVEGGARLTVIGAATYLCPSQRSKVGG